MRPSERAKRDVEGHLTEDDERLETEVEESHDRSKRRVFIAP